MLAMKDFILEFLVKFLPIFLDNFFKVQNLLLLKSKFVFVVLLQGTDVWVT